MTGSTDPTPPLASLHTELDDLLARATHDWLWTASVFDAARSSGLPDGHELIEHAAELLGVALASGLLVPGRIAFGRFAPWTMPPTEAAVRIAEHWRNRPYRLGDLDFSVWFAATEEGLSRGEEAVARESGLDSWTSPVRRALARDVERPGSATPSD